MFRRSFILVVIIVIAMVVVANFAQAQNLPYFEFSPKISDPLNINGQVDDVYQVFLPQNDHLSGIDIWIDNPGIAGEVSFGLRKDGVESLLTAASVNILANVAPTFEGKRIHIDFPAQISISDNQNYSIKILSEIPNFRAYQTNRRFILLGHNAPYTSEYINGVARIGSTEQDFSFKFALYENQETVPPVLTNATTTIISLEEVGFEFNANEPVDFKIQYGLTGGGFLDEISFTGEYTLCSQGASPCYVVLEVVPDSTYNFSLIAKDEWGNEAELTGSFDSAESPEGYSPPVSPPAGENPTPPPTVDTTPPTITNFRVVSVTQSSVKVAWTTNEAANSTLRITDDLEGNGEEIVFILSTVYELEHTLNTPSSLDASTTYYAHIASADLSGNTGDATLEFVTAENNPSVPPPENNPPANPEGGGGSPSQGVAPPVIEFSSEESETDGLLSGKGAVTFKWSIPLEGAPEDGYRLDIFDESGNLVKQIFVGPDEGTEAKIKGLAPGKYTVIIYSNRGGVFERIADPSQIVILPKTFFERIIQFWYIYIAVIAIIVLIPWYFIRKETARLKNI